MVTKRRKNKIVYNEVMVLKKTLCCKMFKDEDDSAVVSTRDNVSKWIMLTITELSSGHETCRSRHGWKRADCVCVVAGSRCRAESSHARFRITSDMGVFHIFWSGSVIN